MSKNLSSLSDQVFVRSVDYPVKLAISNNPKIAFFPTASAENKDYVVNFYKAFSKLNCKPEYISLFQNTPDLNHIVNSSDIIYIGGGNTKSMLAVFREWDLDQMLLKAYQEIQSIMELLQRNVG